MPRLVFHKEGLDSITRLPTLLPNMTETYERLYVIVEELELLLKAWHKRGHLEPVPSNGTLIESAQIDFSLSYVESDTTYPRLFSLSSFAMPKKAARVYKLLTKEKYCQSARTFYDVFDNEAEFESVLRQVRALRKYVYSIVFSKFQANVPCERLPIELWENILVLVMRSSYNQDYLATHSFGVRAKEHKAVLLENDRVTKIFVAVGMLHMLVTEILFKHADMLCLPHDLKIDIGPNRSLAELRYDRTVFFKYYNLFKMSYARLMAIDEKAGPVEKTFNSIADCLENGIVTIKGVNISKVNAFLTNQNQILGMMSSPGQLAFVCGAVRRRGVGLAASYPQIVIWDVEAGKVVTHISIGKSWLDFFPNFWQDTFVFTTDTFAFVEEGPDDPTSFELNSWRMDKADEEGTPKAVFGMGNKEGIIIAHAEDKSSCLKLQLLTVAADRHVVLTLFGSFRSADKDRRTYLTFVGPGSGSLLSKLAVIKYADAGWWRCAASHANHAVLRNKHNNVLHFVRLDRATFVVRSRNLADGCLDKENATVAVAFDEYAPMFTVFCHFMFNCILYSYDESDGPPTPVRRVSSFAPEFDKKTIQSAVLRDGTLFGIYHTYDTYMSPSLSPYSREDSSEVMAFDTAKAKALPVFSMAPNKHFPEDLMMNEYSCAFFVHQIDLLSSPKSLRDLVFVDERTFVVRNDKKMYISVRFNTKPSEVAAVEAEELEEAQKRVDDARDKYVDKLVAATATLYMSGETCGFAVLDGDAKPLGCCFVRASELPHNMSARDCVTIRCHLVHDADKLRLLATNVEVVDD